MFDWSECCARPQDEQQPASAGRATNLGAETVGTIRSWLSGQSGCGRHRRDGREHTRTSELPALFSGGFACLERRAGSAAFLLLRRWHTSGLLEPDAPAVLVDDLNPGGFKSSADREIVSCSQGSLAIRQLRASDRRDANFRGQDLLRSTSV